MQIDFDLHQENITIVVNLSTALKLQSVRLYWSGVKVQQKQVAMFNTV